MDADGQPQFYQVTLDIGDAGDYYWELVSEWIGWSDTKPTREIRQASVISEDAAIQMSALFDSEGWSLVRHEDEFDEFLLNGGHAFIERSIAEEHIPEQLEPQEVGRASSVGLQDIARQPATVTAHKPVRRLRMEVLRRDGYKCRICGRRVLVDNDVELQLHHIAAWGERGRGGLTVSTNLITLCKACHDGIAPEQEYELYALIGQSIQEYMAARRTSPAAAE